MLADIATRFIWFIASPFALACIALIWAGGAGRVGDYLERKGYSQATADSVTCALFWYAPPALGALLLFSLWHAFA